MRNKQIIIGLAAAGAAIAIAARLMSKKQSKAFDSENREANRNQFKGKLNNLQRKAQKEYRQTLQGDEDVANAAKERANQWVNQSHH